MKIDMLKIFLVSITFAVVLPAAQAQFDDVYYDADQIIYGSNQIYSDTESYGAQNGITFYDNDTYDYVDDYDYYYTSRIRRFYRPYIGFGFYDPWYTSYNYYDPYGYDYYAYPSASIYLGVGFGFGIGYAWNPWYSWNNWNSWNNCGYYGGYGGGYWGGYGNCSNWNGYGNCYNNYYNCTPIACYNPPGYHDGYPGGSNGVYYGPRVSGNTGVSPRVPITTNGTNPPGYSIPNKDVARPNDQPAGQIPGDLPGRANQPGTTKHTMPGATPAGQSHPMEDGVASINERPSIDKELTKDKPSSTGRPVFKPDVKYQPYPAPDRGRMNTTNPSTRNDPSYRPYTPGSRSSGLPPQENARLNPQATNPGDKPIRINDVPVQTSPDTRSRSDRPTYTPPPRSNQNQNNTRSSGSNDRPSYAPPARSNSAPSYSPPSGGSQQRSGNSGSSNYSNRSSSPSSSGSRSSGGSSSRSSTSPRGKG